MTKPLVHYLGRNDTDCSLTFSINGDRYEYLFGSILPVDSFDYVARKISPLKALNYSKARAIETKKVPA